MDDCSSPKGQLVTSLQPLHRYFLRGVCDRPQYRSVVAFVFPNGARIDTDGDAIPATSTTWTWLSIRRSVEVTESIEIYPTKQTPLSLVIESKSSELAARAAYFLAKSMDTAILVTEVGPAIDFADVEAAMGKDFNVAEAMHRKDQPESQR